MDKHKKALRRAAAPPVKTLSVPGRIPGGTKRHKREELAVNTRVAVISIIVENPESTGALNRLLHDYSEYIIGRMGIPYREKGINIICVAVDAPQDAINTLTGLLGRLNGISAKAAYSKS